VRIHHADRSVSVATLGKTDSGEIETAVSARIRQLQEKHAGPRCALLEGTADCATCPTPFPAQISKSITVQRDPAATTIARVTCPTAPTFWKWHLLPRIVPREVRFPDEEEHEHEWKWQLLAAGLCGAFALAGHFAGGGTVALAFYIWPMSRRWFTTHDVWELCTRDISTSTFSCWPSRRQRVHRRVARRGCAPLSLLTLGSTRAILDGPDAA
jgi:Cd2+/Zn2+-exporting ATPase